MTSIEAKTIGPGWGGVFVYKKGLSKLPMYQMHASRLIFVG